MSYSFDLRREPWIPCGSQEGGQRLLGLRETLVQAHALTEIQGDTPLVTAALLRLLLALLHRVYGPKDKAAWGALWERGAFDPAPLDAYFAKWHDRFDLFHPERPFLQRADKRTKGKTIPTSKLFYHHATSGAQTLYDHSLDDSGRGYTPAQAAWGLLTQYNFGVAGLSMVPRVIHSAAPGVGGILFFVTGQSLFETLMLNLVRYPDEGGDDTPEDRPNWEIDDPRQPDRDTPLGLLDALTWPDRNILLLQEDGAQGTVVRRITMLPAMRMQATVQNTMMHYRKGGALGWKTLRFSVDRALWRDSSALFRLRRDESAKDSEYIVPSALEWIYRLIRRPGRVLNPAVVQRSRLMALGMLNNQAKVEFLRAEAMPLSDAYLLNEELVDDLAMMLDLAEKVRGQLWGAAATMANLILVPETGEGIHEPDRKDRDNLTGHWAIERDYWSLLELPFGEAMRALPEENPEKVIKAWCRTLQRTAWRALERVTRSLEQDATTLKAVVESEGQLGAGLAKVLNDYMGE